MKGWLLAATLVLAGCSDVTETAGGVVALEITLPQRLQLEVGDTVQLAARALDRDGEVVAAQVTWRSADPSVWIEETTGRVTGVIGGQSGRVQATLGSLASGLTRFDVFARADTLLLPADSVFDVLSTDPASPPLLARLDGFEPAEPVANREIVYTVTVPEFADPAQRTVELPGGVLVDTVVTGADGLPTAPPTLARVIGTTQPAEAIVVVRAFRPSGAEIAGSGHRFIVRFQ